MDGVLLAADTIDINIPTLIWAAVNFILLVAILAKVLWKPVIQMLDDRRKEVESNLSQAEQARAEVQQLREDYNRQLSQSQREAQEMIDKATRAAAGQREEILATARGEAEELLERARTTISQERDQAITELRQEVAMLTVMAAERLLRRSMSDSDHHHLAEEIVAELVTVND